MPFGIDIQEDELRSWGYGILETLLCDHTTGGCIIWATDDYAGYGDGYTFHDQITVERICCRESRIIVPRVLKDKQSQKNRARKMAEVFTPSWLCNQMLNNIDERLFGRKDVFNTCTEMGKVWQPTDAPVFKDNDTLKWKD